MADWYVNSATGNDTTGDGSSGSPYASPGKAGGAAADADRILIKGPGTYSLTTATPNVSGGPIQRAGSASQAFRVEGYSSTAGDGASLSLANRPVIQWGTNPGSATAIIDGGEGGVVHADYVAFDGNLKANGLLLRVYNQYNSRLANCSIRNFATSLIAFGSPIALYSCEITGCTATIGGFWMFDCDVHDNPASGTRFLGGGTLWGCRFYGNDCTYVAATESAELSVVNCVFYNNTGGAIGLYNSVGFTSIINNIFAENGTYGVNIFTGTQDVVFMSNNAFYANGQTSGVPSYMVRGSVTLTGSPFTNAAGGDFTLNNTAGAGAACRAAGLIPYGDIGARQHQDTGGGGSPVTRIRAGR